MENLTAEFRGTVEEVVYFNTDNHYAVIFLLSDGGEAINAVGTMPFVTEGEEALVRGVWKSHGTYGKQLSVTYYEKIMPQKASDILKYLSSRAIKGIGPKTARSIVERYGVDTFSVIEQHPEYLSDIPGISRKKAAAIHKCFCDMESVRHVMMLCSDILSPTLAARASKILGRNAEERIKENPYILCERVDGVSFTMADRLAEKLGVLPSDEFRLQNALLYILEYNAVTNGHTCLPKDKLISATAVHLGVDEALVSSALDECMRDNRLIPFQVSDTEMIFLSRYAEAESYIAKRLCELDRTAPAFSYEDVERLVERAEQSNKLIYAPLQHHAIRESLSGGVLIVTGGPGTGKTTIVKALADIFDSLGMKVALVAPTGRAAKRMSEATGRFAQTLHRMLEMEFYEDGHSLFRRNETNPTQEDVVIVDEASMMDVLLMEALLRASKRGSRFVFIGDADQLPSVGAGNLLCDLIDSDAFRVVRLTEIFRQSEESLIVTNAHRINRGEEPDLQTKDKDFFFLQRQPWEIASTIVSLTETRLPRAYGEDIKTKIQVVTPAKKGGAGTENLNRLLQASLNPPSPHKKEHIAHGVTFREGDKVMQIRNNYDVLWTKNGVEGNGVFNGDVGIISSINEKEKEMKILFDERMASYDFSMLDELEHAYAITVHKSQGSEYPLVIFPLYECPPLLRTRNLFYTAVTRAKEKVILVGMKEIALQMVKNNRQVVRYTAIKERLKK